MTQGQTRRECLVGAGSAVAGLVASASLCTGARGGVDGAAGPAVSGSFPSQDPEQVRSIVGASHRSLEIVQELLKGSPRLANCAYDWGFGDWETPLGAAAHTGRRAIALLLIKYGARPDLFALAMLGEVEAVRATLAAMPLMARIKGPHGLTLMHHALAGGEQAQGVVELLRGIDGADDAYPVRPVADTSIYLGAYRFGPGTADRVEIEVDKQAFLAMKRPGGSLLRLYSLGEHRFHPVGAPETVIEFAMEAGRASGFAVTTPAPLVVAKRE